MIRLLKAMLAAVDTKTRRPYATADARAQAYTRYLLEDSQPVAVGANVVPEQNAAIAQSWPLAEYGLRLGETKAYSLPMVCCH